MGKYDKQWSDLDSQVEGKAIKAYGSFVDNPWTWVVGSIVLMAAIVLIGWQVGWWFTVQNEKRQGTILNIQSHNLRHNFGFQQNLRDDINKNIGNVLAIQTQIAQAKGDAAEQTVLRAQAKGIISNIICPDAGQVEGDPLLPSAAGFVSQNCEGGNLSPNSPFAH